MSDSIDAHYESLEEAPRKKRWGWWLFGCGCVLPLLLVGGCAFNMFRLSRGVNHEFEPVLIEFLGQVDDGNYAEAYAMTSSGWKESQDEASFQRFSAAIHASLGKSPPDFELGGYGAQWNGDVRVSFYGPFEKGEAEVRATFEREGGEWRLKGAYFNSNALLGSLTCSSCQAISKGLTSYCPSCGEPMLAMEDAVEAEEPAAGSDPKAR